MKCAWQAYVQLLPHWMREQVHDLGKETLQELRLRIEYPPELVLYNECRWLQQIVTVDDLLYCINAASQYSPWSSTSSANGYITAPGGHRLGICGRMVMSQNGNRTISTPTSVCLRVARDFNGLTCMASDLHGSTLIIGRPGSGKTTLLRDLVRQISERRTIAVVDERGEVFPAVNGVFCFRPGSRTEVLTGCSKIGGIEILIRTMNPHWVAVDEITAEEDCKALIQAAWCGVSVLATAHAGSAQDLLHRPVYRPLLDSGIFDNLIIMQQDKSWTLERMNA